MVGSPCRAAAIEGPRTLEDSTVVESWSLPNGLRVVTRHVPNAGSVAITVCYRTGTSQDPPGKEGLASLLAEVDFMSPAGPLPERTREEMASLRPLGWNLKVTRNHTELSEIGSRRQFPGMIHQVAQRMRGVTVTPESFRRSVATVSHDLADTYSGRPDLALHHSLGEWAAGRTHQEILRYGSGKGLRAISAKEIQERLRALYVPARATLGIAGDLSGVDVHRLLEQEFAGIPAGTPSPDTPRGSPRAGSFVMPKPSGAPALGAIGITAPALTDSLHPSFYLNVLVLGSAILSQWGPPTTPLSSRFQYSILDEPDLVRFYPTLSDSTADSLSLVQDFNLSIGEVSRMTMNQEAYDRVREGVTWLLGGPLTPDLLRRMKSDPAVMYSLSSSMAAREMLGGDAFWTAYRRHFEEDPDPGLIRWLEYFVTRDHQVILLMK